MDEHLVQSPARQSFQVFLPGVGTGVTGSVRVNYRVRVSF